MLVTVTNCCDKYPNDTATWVKNHLDYSWKLKLWPVTRYQIEVAQSQLHWRTGQVTAFPESAGAQTRVPDAKSETGGGPD